MLNVLRTLIVLLTLFCIIKADLVPTWIQLGFNCEQRAYRRALNDDSSDWILHRYVWCDTFFDSKNGAIFFYAGNEDGIWTFVNHTGNIFKMAKDLNALVVFHECRFYGSSYPQVSSWNNKRTWQKDFTFDLWQSLVPKEKRSEYYRSYLRTDDILDDYIEFCEQLKKKWPKSQIIAIGGSFAGELSAWLRIKRPDMFTGAVAASAPFFAFPGYHLNPTVQDCTPQFDEGVTKDFLDVSRLCAEAVATTWRTIELMAENLQLAELKKVFNICDNTDFDTRVDVYWELYGAVRTAIVYSAMADYPFESNFLSPKPANPVNYICEKIALHVKRKSDLKKVGPMVGAVNEILNAFFNYTGETGHCYKSFNALHGSEEQWQYQTCYDTVSPSCSAGLFPEIEWDAKRHEKYCYETFGTISNPYWASNTFGNSRKFLYSLSNTILSNGERDPWSRLGVKPKYIELISQTTSSKALVVKSLNGSKTSYAASEKDVIAINIPGAAHHEDLVSPSVTTSAEIHAAQALELSIIKKWIESAREASPSLLRKKKRFFNFQKPNYQLKL